MAESSSQEETSPTEEPSEGAASKPPASTPPSESSASMSSAPTSAAPDSMSKGPRVSLMPWNDTGNTAAGGIFVVGAIILLPLLIGVVYYVVRDEPPAEPAAVTEPAP